MLGTLQKFVGIVLLLATSPAFATIISLTTKPTPFTKNFAQLGFSSPEEMRDYMTIAKITVHPVNDTPYGYGFYAQAPELKTPEVATPDVGVPSTWDQWYAIGEKIWKIITNGKPVANVTTQKLHILPKDNSEWIAMESWQGPVTKAYQVNMTNLLGMNVIQFHYRTSFNYGGTWKGAGAYLANLTILPEKVRVSWGYQLNSSVEAGQILNTGTTASPIPAVELQVKWTVDTITTHIEGVDAFFAKGSGQIIRAQDQ